MRKKLCGEEYKILEFIWRYLAVFLMSALPIVELKGGMVLASSLHIPLIEAFPIAVLGTMFPVPFILLLFQWAVNFFKHIKFIGPFLTKLNQKANEKAMKLGKFTYISLFLFVAIPLPGTGAWTGSMIASVLSLRIKHSIIVIVGGVLVNAIIMSFISYGVLDYIISLFK